MKKLMLFVALMGVVATCSAGDKLISVPQLPQAAQTQIETTFKNSPVAVAKSEGFFCKSYEVKFVNGDKIEFDCDGNWTEVSSRTAVPSALVPQQIKDYVAKTYPDVKIQKIEKERRKFEVKLSNRFKVTFDANFNVIDLDD